MTGSQTIATMIGKSGCLFLSYLRLMYFLEGKDITDGELLAEAVEVYDKLVAEDIMDSECFVKKPVKLIETTYPKLNKKYTVFKADKIPADAPAYVISYNGKHFTIADKKGKIVWDSFGTAHIKTAEATPATSYRILKECK